MASDICQNPTLTTASASAAARATLSSSSRFAASMRAAAARSTCFLRRSSSRAFTGQEGRWNKHSIRDRSLAKIQGGYSCSRVYSVRGLNVGGVHVLSIALASSMEAAGFATAGGSAAAAASGAVSSASGAPPAAAAAAADTVA